MLLVFVALQFYRPEKNISQGNHASFFVEETNPPQAVKKTLIKTCYDCHSDNTTYPWYNNVAPVSYWLYDHVNEGKEHLNFSDWDNYSMKQKNHKLEELIEEVSESEMPLNTYRWVHKNARLSKAQIDSIVSWAERTRILYQLEKRPM